MNFSPEVFPAPRLSDAAETFIASVLAGPSQIVVFDCDGTLWAGDAGADFFYWEIDRGVIPEPARSRALARYDEYNAGRVSEEAMCGEMVQMHRGLQAARMRELAVEFFEEVVAARIFPEMLELTRRLRAQGAELWAVSSSNDWIIAAGAERFGIPLERVLATAVERADGVCTDRLVRVPSGEGKAVAIREVIARPVDAVFGNSIHDAAMLAIAARPYVINPNPDLENMARERGWPVYWPKG